MTRAWTRGVMVLLAGCAASPARMSSSTSLSATSASGSSTSPRVDALESDSQFQAMPDVHLVARTCQLPYSRYLNRSEVFAWNPSVPRLPAHVRMRLRVKLKGVQKSAIPVVLPPLQAWLLEDGRLFLRGLDEELPPEERQRASPVCQLTADDLARFDAVLRSPQRLLPRRFEERMPSDDEMLELPDALSFPLVLKYGADVETPACFADEKMIHHFKASELTGEEFSEGMRLQVAMGDREMHVTGENSYDWIMAVLLRPVVQGCPAFENRLQYSAPGLLL